MPNRTTAERKRDVLASLEREEDAWLASANADGSGYLIPLSYHWDGARLIFATLEGSATIRNLRRVGRTRAALPSTRDTIVLEGEIAFVPPAELPAVADAFVARLTWDPRSEPQPYTFFCLLPHRIQTWRDAAELDGRDVMRDGVWLA